MGIQVVIAVFLVGLSAGLRTFTAPAVVAWAAYLGWIDRALLPLSFISSPVAVGVLTLMAAGEYVFDLLPGTPNRTAPPGLIARIFTGSLSAACLLGSAGASLSYCALGGVFAVAAAFTGYQARTRLVRGLNVKDAFIAAPEDLIAVGLAVTSVLIAR